MYLYTSFILFIWRMSFIFFQPDPLHLFYVTPWCWPVSQRWWFLFEFWSISNLRNIVLCTSLRCWCLYGFGKWVRWICLQGAQLLWNTLLKIFKIWGCDGWALHNVKIDTSVHKVQTSARLREWQFYLLEELT